MNKKGNQRFTQTEQRIKGVFLQLLKEKEFPKISVSEICSRAAIHRTTFYVHYLDVNDLMEKMVADMYLQAMHFFLKQGEKMQGGESRGDGFRNLFQMILEHQEFFRAYFQMTQNTKWQHMMLPELLEKKAEALYQRMGFASKEELYYHQTFFTAGLTAIIRRWIGRDCQETPEQMSKILRDEYVANKSYLWERNADF